MGVFFSGTDESELYGNCPNHNIYLSLIVNNKNDMIARIAFVAEQKSLTLKMKSPKGEEINRVIEHPKAEPFIFEYECDIILPEGVNYETFQERVEKLRSEAPTNNYSRTGWGDRTHQGDFFHGTTERGSRATREEWEETERTPQRISNAAKERVESFLRAVIDDDEYTKCSLGFLVKTMEGTLRDQSKKERDKFLAKMMKNLGTYYEKVFPDDPKFLHFDTTLRAAIEALNPFSPSCREAYEELTDMLGTAIVNYNVS
jgi:hypothetical protein